MVDISSLCTARGAVPAPRTASASPAAQGEAAHGPDLCVDGFYATNPMPFPGQPVWFGATIRNQGDAPAGPFSVELRSPAFTPDVRVPGLQPGQSVRLSNLGPVWTSFQGPWSAEVIVDARREVPDVNPGNNYEWTTVWTQQPPMPPPLPPMPIPGHPAAPATLLAE